MSCNNEYFTLLDEGYKLLDLMLYNILPSNFYNSIDIDAIFRTIVRLSLCGNEKYSYINYTIQDIFDMNYYGDTNHVYQILNGNYLIRTNLGIFEKDKFKVLIKNLIKNNNYLTTIMYQKLLTELDHSIPRLQKIYNIENVEANIEKNQILSRDLFENNFSTYINFSHLLNYRNFVLIKHQFFWYQLLLWETFICTDTNLNRDILYLILDELISEVPEYMYKNKRLKI